MEFATAIILVDDGDTERKLAWQKLCRQLSPEVPQFVASPKTDGLWQLDQRVELESDSSWLCFCGLAEPSRFIEMIEGLKGCRFFKAFPDHHSYSPADLAWLVSEKKRYGAMGFITTDKDYDKVAPGLSSQGERVVSLRISYVLSDEFWYFLKMRLE